MFTATAIDVSMSDKVKKAPKRKRVAVEDSGDTAKRRSARVRNTKCKKEEKIDFQELLFKYLPSRYLTLNYCTIHKYMSCYNCVERLYWFVLG